MVYTKPASRDEALTLARRAAARARELGAKQVILFGSLADGRYLPEVSDIDIYFDGVTGDAGDLVLIRLLDEFGEGTIDPVPAQYCPPHIKAEVDAEGVAL